MKLLEIERVSCNIMGQLKDWRFMSSYFTKKKLYAQSKKWSNILKCHFINSSQHIHFSSLDPNKDKK